MEPRIKISGLSKGINAPNIYDVCKKFGLVTYIGVLKHEAIVEFADSVSVDKVLAKQPLRICSKKLSVVKLPDWLPGIKTEMMISLDPDIAKILHSAESLEEEARRLVVTADSLAVLPTDGENPPVSKHAVCSVLERVLEADFQGNVSVYPFGSRVTGLALETSDLDLFIDCGDMFSGEYDQEHKEQAMMVEIVRRCLVKQCKEFNYVKSVPQARVPIVRFLHIPSDTRCDAAFLNGMGCRKSRLIRFLVSLDDRVRPLLLLLKRWVYTIDLTPEHGSYRPQLTSHALTMLVFSYLQTSKPPVLPPIKALKERAGYSYVIAGMETAFSDDAGLFRVADPFDRRSLCDLFLGFLRYLQRTDWHHMAADPLEGAMVRRCSLPRGVGSPSSVLVVLDPMDTGRNLTINVSERTFCRLRAICALTERAMGAA